METIRTRQLEQEISILRNALFYYADERIYKGANQDPIKGLPYVGEHPGVYLLDVTRDGGNIARNALNFKN